MTWAWAPRLGACARLDSVPAVTLVSQTLKDVPAKVACLE